MFKRIFTGVLGGIVGLMLTTAAYGWKPGEDGKSIEEILNTAFDSTTSALKATVSGSASMTNITGEYVTATTQLSADGKIVWGGGRTHYLALGTDIDAFIASGLCANGDTIVLPSGTITITDDIDVSKSVNIRGAGIGKTTVAGAKNDASFATFLIGASNVRIADMTITATGNLDPNAIQAGATTYTGIVVENCAITTTASLTGLASSAIELGAGTIRDCVLTSTGSTANDFIFGIHHLDGGTVDVYNCNISATGRVTAYGVYNDCVNTNSITNLYNCKITSTQAIAGCNSSGVYVDPSVGAGQGTINCYGCTLSGSDYDAQMVGTTTLKLVNTTLANGTTSGTITYDGTVVSEDAFYSDDTQTVGTITGGRDNAGGTPNDAGSIKLFSSGDDALYNTFTAGDNTANATYTLPTAMPAVSGYALTCTDAGVMSWAAMSSGIPQSEPATGNMVVGTNAGHDITATTGNYNVFLGQEAGHKVTTSPNNTAVGYAAGGGTSGAAGTGNGGNNSIGYLAGQKLTTGEYNDSFGYSAGTSLTSGYGNAIIGQNSGLNVSTGYQNVFIGQQAGALGPASSAAADNVMIGYLTGNNSAVSGLNNNIFIGSAVGRTCGGSDNTVIGAYASTSSAIRSKNVIIGSQAGYAGANTTDNGVMIGYGAGYNSDGSNNICIGYQAGDNITTGTGNLILGYDLNADSATANGQMNIGGVLKATGIDGANKTATIVGALTHTPDEITATSEGVAASLYTVVTEITSNGDSDLDNVTLANGTSGQIKHFVWTVAGNAADTLKITPATTCGTWTQITFGAGAVGSGCTMIYSDSEGWTIVGQNGGTIA